MKKLVKLLTSITIIFMLLLPTSVFADARLSITATPIAGENYMKLNWTNLGAGYTYTVYAKGQDEEIYQSIPAKCDVKVLNVYPDVGNNLKTWMETNGYGRGLISVDEVSITNFNNNPEIYMKDTNGNWKYDVIYFGAWNCNNEINFNDLALIYIEDFIKTGRGVLAGHDTIGYHWNNSGLNKLRAYFNIKVGNWENNYSGIDEGYNYYAGFAGTEITVKKKGLLTNYPWNIGDVGTKLTVPLSHSTSNFALGDIWMTYPDDSLYVWNAPENLKKFSNFYLTTWNNCAMIQTGHSNGEATEDEQKLIANTLFYLAQLTSENSCDDHKSQDISNPDKVIINKISDDNKNLTVNYSKSKDNGTEYKYYVKATNYIAPEIISDTVSAINTSGLAGYSYVIDNIENTEPDNVVDTTDLSISVPLSDLDVNKPIYIHIKAIDKAGNYSETTHSTYMYSSKIELDQNSIVLAEGSTAKLNATVTSISYTNSDIKWTSSDELVATVDNAGNVTALKTGKAIITAQLADTDTISTCEVNVVNVGMNKEKINLAVDETTALEVIASYPITTGIDWKSSDESIATVDSEGNVKAVGTGNAVISAQIRGTGIKVYCNVSIYSISLDKTELSLIQEETHQLIATASSSIVWKSSDETIAVVDVAGNVTAIGVGTAIITAQIAGTDISANCSVNVSALLPVLYIEPELENAKLNHIVSVNLIIDNIKEIAAEDVIIKYDSSKLQFINAEEVDGIMLIKNDIQSGELRFILASKGLENIINTKKTLLKLNFKTIEVGEALIDITKGRVSDGIEMEKSLKDSECGQATIIILDPKLGDVNRDGEFTLLDLAIVARHYGEDPAALPQYNTDIDINQAIDKGDLTQIARYMLANPNYKV
ncbi:Ig-like domain-containing protein [Ruminiclostridium herbifermentans]|uniref:Ig-like domain-containing protein n=1 Tax=Ruminiclostridium herbifermentans TaxID=2488810 RepID=UPI0010F6BDEE|nr:Ig-like domain-containing protein [Ruminiclostridium herbifermentans]